MTDEKRPPPEEDGGRETTKKIKTKRKRREDKPLSLHPLTPEEALRKLLNTPPMERSDPD